MNRLKRLCIVSVSLVVLLGGSFVSKAEDNIRITLFGGAVAQEGHLIQEAIQQYMDAHPNIEIKLVAKPDSATECLLVYRKTLTDENERTKFDIYQIDVIWPGEIGQHFLDLTPYQAAEAAKDHFPAMVQNNMVDGQLIAMPWFTDAGLLFYRTDLLKKYGFAAPPQTWDELELMAKTIQDGEVQSGNENFWGFVWQGDVYEGLTCNVLEWIASSGGGTFIDPKKQVTINNPNALKALKRAAKWRGYISPPAVTGFQEEDSRRWWQAGNAAFMRNWPYCYAAGNAAESPIKGKFAVAPLPGEVPEQSAATLGGWQLAVSKYSKHPDIAADIVLFLTSKAEQKRRAILGSYSPTIKSLYTDQEVLQAVPFFGSLYQVFVSTVARPSAQTAPNYSRASQAIFMSVHEVLTDQKEAQTALEELEIDLGELVTAH